MYMYIYIYVYIYIYIYYVYVRAFGGPQLPNSGPRGPGNYATIGFKIYGNPILHTVDGQNPA